MYTADNNCKIIEIFIDNIFVQFRGCLVRQVTGIPMKTNCAPLLADLFLYSYENKFIDNMIRRRVFHRRLISSTKNIMQSARFTVISAILKWHHS